MSINKFGFYALVGESGQGKSTLIDILTKFYIDYKGTISFNNETDINTIQPVKIREKISVILQEPFLFNDTIMANLKLHTNNFTEEEIIEKSKKYNFYTFINKMPKGFETIVGNGGHNISRGEKQRISLFTVLLKEPDLLILDEATNSIDSLNEEYFNAFLKEYSKKHIVLSITHNYTRIKEFDKIFILANKQIFEEGTFEELNRNSKIFNKLSGLVSNNE